MFARGKWDEPVIRFPCPGNEASIVVRCSPVLYKHRIASKTTNLPYRMIFAVGTFSSVLLYDTSQLAPIALISEIHYASITDMSWSADGKILSICSNDGYCTFVQFEDGELGERLEVEKIPDFMKRPLPKVVLPKKKKKLDVSTAKKPTGSSTTTTTTTVVNLVAPRSSSGSDNKKRAVLVPLSGDLSAAKPSAAFM